MITTRNLICAAALLVLVCPTLAQFQVVHDVPNTATIPELTPVMLSDGTTATHQWNAGEHIFRKYGMDGTLLWSRSMEGALVFVNNGGKAAILSSDEAGGFVFAAFEEIEISPTQNFDEDSVVQTFLMARMDGNGVVTSASRLKKRFTRFMGSATYADAFDAAGTADGGSVLCITANGSSISSIDLVKVSEDGALQWSRSVGQSTGPWQTGEPTFAFNISAAASVAASPNGTIYYSENGNGPYNHLRLGALDGSGEMLWMKRYVYGNTSPIIQYHDIAVDAGGNVHAVGALLSTVGTFHIFLRTDPNGVLEDGDLYRTPQVLMEGELGVDGLGRRYHLVNTLVPPTGTPYSHGLLIADTLGTPGRFLRKDDQVVLPNNVFTVPQRMDISGDHLALSHVLHHEDVDLSYTTRYEALSLFDQDAITPCLMDDTTFAHVAIPLDPVITTTEITEAVSLDISAYYTSEPIDLVLSPLAAEEMDPLCPFISELLGVNTGVDSANEEERAPLIQNTVLKLGTPISLNGTAMMNVEVYNGSGMLLQRSLLDDSRSLATSSWSSGVYVIRAVDRQGNTAGLGRVVLE